MTEKKKKDFFSQIVYNLTESTEHEQNKDFENCKEESIV